MITNHDFRYPETLRLEFDEPVGIFSYGFETETELRRFYDEVEPDYSFDLLVKYNHLDYQIFKIFKEFLEKYRKDTSQDFNLDWRDELEIEIHNIDQDKFDDSVIQDINFKLKELVGG